MFEFLDPQILRESVEPLLLALSQFAEPLTLIALGIGALVTLAGVRLFIFACAAAGLVGTWMLVQGLTFVELPWPVAASVAALLVGGIVEAIVVAIGGREAAPTFWATVLVAVVIFVLLSPMRFGLRLAGTFAGFARLPLRGRRRG